ncbi:hypothetical protein M8J75_012758 [Diaphorina citri]|nr:hypothetical protein M8J75_012758 [Diaphorina citri]
MGGHPIVSVGNGVSLCGVCHLCTCLNMTFLRTAAGKLKLAEIIIGAICQTILLNFGSPYVPTLGMSYESFLCAVSSSLTTTTLLTVTYLLSRTSCSLVRSSIFEILFNLVACNWFLCSSFFLSFAVHASLYPIYMITPFYTVYYAMTAAYILGAILGLTYAFDAYVAYSYYKGSRYTNSTVLL